jgi:hypothetical protein
MKRKRFLKLCMSQAPRKEAELAVITAWCRYKNYEDAWNAWHGIIKGRFSAISW